MSNQKRETRNQKHFSGRINWFSQQRGFGFIARESQGGEPVPDLFVHVKSVRGAGPRELHIGDHVSFEIGKDQAGRPVAINVRVQIRAEEPAAAPHTRE